MKKLFGFLLWAFVLAACLLLGTLAFFEGDMVAVINEINSVPWVKISWGLLYWSSIAVGLLVCLVPAFIFCSCDDDQPIDFSGY